MGRFGTTALGTILCCAFAGAEELRPPPLRVIDVQPDEAMNRRFAGTDGWIGADGVYSIPLPDQSVLWVFGDTLVGKIRDGKRRDFVMVNQSFARQTGREPENKTRLFVQQDRQGQPVSFVTPDNQPGYFWLWDGIVLDEKLHLIATRLTSPGTITAFDWTLEDQSLITVENPLDEPTRWRFRQQSFPFGAFTDEYEAIWGTEVLLVDGEVIVYGTRRFKKGEPRSLVAAKMPPRDLTNFPQWRFFRDGGWTNDPRQASALAADVGTEGSVTWLPKHQRFVYVYSPPLDPNIKMRTASTPFGPWSDAVTIYTCPETAWNPRVFCYAGKARLVPETTDQLLISYATNSFDMLPDVTADARIYFPRFVKAKVRD